MVPPSGRLFRTWSRRAAVVPRRTTMTGPDDSQAGLPDLYPVTVAWVTAGAVLAAAVAAAEQPAVSAVAATAASTLPGLRTLISSMPGSPARTVPLRLDAANPANVPPVPQDRGQRTRGHPRPRRLCDRRPDWTSRRLPRKRGAASPQLVPTRTSHPVHSPSPTRLDH